MRSWLDLDNYSEISARSQRIWRNIGQISIDPTKICQDSTRFRPKSGQISTPYSEPETDRYALETDKTRFGRSEAPHGSVVDSNFSHLSLSGQVQVRHKLDSGRLVDTPNYNFTQ